MRYPPISFPKQNNVLFLRSFMILLLSCITIKIKLCLSSNHPTSLKTLAIDGYFSFNEVHRAAKDFGNRFQMLPMAVLYPKSVNDIATTVKYIWHMGTDSELTVAARGHGHSLQGQAQAHQGIVVNMESLQVPRMSVYAGNHPYVDVSGGELWINVLHESLFHGVLGGLGQFGIITRARISLEPAPQKVKWIRVLYSDFTKFTRDQENLIAADGAFDYIEGFVIINRTGLLNNWRSSFDPQDEVQASQFKSDGRTLFCLELAKYFDSDKTEKLNEEIMNQLSQLRYIPSTLFLTEVPYIDFLDRVHVSEIKLRTKGLWEIPHPWLNLLIPKSRIHNFANEVFGNILTDTSNGPVLIAVEAMNGGGTVLVLIGSTAELDSTTAELSVNSIAGSNSCGSYTTDEQHFGVFFFFLVLIDSDCQRLSELLSCGGRRFGSWE